VLTGAVELLFPDCSQGVAGRNTRVSNLAALALGKGDHHRLASLVNMLGESSPSTQRFVIGVGEHPQ
jgi:hypothetical protein